MRLKILITIVAVVLIVGVAGWYLDHSPRMQQAITDDTNANNYGAAPEFTGINHWLNSDPLTMASLRGKVVLIDFWTYSCINCIRTLPTVESWYEKYKDQGLVVVGVHAPEFAFEKETANVAKAITQYGLTYPIAQDNDYGTWSAYHNQYWPAHYLIDQQGNIVYTHFGEGKYAETEAMIQKLLGLNEPTSTTSTTTLDVRTPEIYFGLDRLEYLTPSQQPQVATTTYVLSVASVPANTFALGGDWQFKKDSAQLVKAPGAIKLHFYASKAYIVASASTPIMVTPVVDGVAQSPVEIHDSKLYQLFTSDTAGEHTLELQLPTAGLQAFTFTFG